MFSPYQKDPEKDEFLKELILVIAPVLVLQIGEGIRDYLSSKYKPEQKEKETKNE